MLAGFNAGDKVRLTSKFLRSTGQYKGADANGEWLVQACPCTTWVCLNQPFSNARDTFTADEIKAQPCLVWRHAHPANLEKCK